MTRFESALEAESKTVKFGDIVALEDSKRIPLNSRDREARKGPYPYYGATSVMDYVDDYLFDEVRVLLGEDGTVIDSEGKPILQYVWGKYWVNNHAHILAPSGDYSLEAIYVALRRTAINHIVTGAVQMKISQRNLKSLELEMPSPESLDFLQDLFTVYRCNQDESAKLASLRDALLPKLMSGEIDVSKIDPTQLNSHLAAYRPPCRGLRSSVLPDSLPTCSACGWSPGNKADQTETICESMLSRGEYGLHLLPRALRSNQRDSVDLTGGQAIKAAAKATRRSGAAALGTF